jgi:diacylglycerol kinase family enzyme
MKTVWLIINRGSRAVADSWEATLIAAFAARGATVAGTTDFPGEALPTPAILDAAQVDVAAVAAGDGTINAVTRQLENWGGSLLILPGGTMNLLAKQLHASLDPATIIAAVAHPPALKQLATIDSGNERAVVGVIIGPGASWVHAREAVRAGRWDRLRRALRFAYLRTLSHAVRLRQGNRRSKPYRAIFVHAGEDALSIVKISASGWPDGVRLGFGYLTGTWEQARGVETATADAITLADDRPTFALFDGEPTRLPPDATLRFGQTRLRFVTTI